VNHQAAQLTVNHQTKQLKTTAEARKAHPAGDRQEQVAACQESILALSSPAGIVEDTPGTIVKATGRNFHLVSGQDTNLAVGRKLVMAIQDAWSVLAAQGIKLFAGKGDIQIQAHEGSIHAVGQKDTKLIACNQGIDLAAPDTITLASGGCKVTLAGGSITLLTPGNVNCKAKWNVVMAQAKNYDLPNLPKVGEIFNQGFQVKDPATGEPIPGTLYELTTESGKKIRGYTDSSGFTGKLSAREQEGVKIALLDKEIECASGKRG
jgi:type VI secretion system secreted protein VgrG